MNNAKIAQNNTPSTMQPSLFDSPIRDYFFIIWPVYKYKVSPNMKFEKVKIGELRFDFKGKFHPHESRLDVQDRYEVFMQDMQVISGTLFDMYEYLPCPSDIHETALKLYANHIESNLNSAA